MAKCSSTKIEDGEYVERAFFPFVSARRTEDRDRRGCTAMRFPGLEFPRTWAEPSRAERTKKVKVFLKHFWVFFWYLWYLDDNNTMHAGRYWGWECITKIPNLYLYRKYMKTDIEDIDFMVRTDSRRNRHTALRTHARTHRLRPSG